MFRPITTRFTLSSLVSSVVLLGICNFASALPTGIQKTDVDGGGSINGNKYSVETNVGDRAELRGTNGGSTLKGTMRITEWTSSTTGISIIQVLNQKSNNASDGSEPVAQLGIRVKDGKREFYIVQKGQSCGGLPAAKLNTNFSVSVSYKSGSSPVFSVNGSKCQKDTGRKPGKFGGKTVPFYPKLGAYVTKSGRGPATITWTGVSKN